MAKKKAESMWYGTSKHSRFYSFNSTVIMESFLGSSMITEYYLTLSKTRENERALNWPGYLTIKRVKRQFATSDVYDIATYHMSGHLTSRRAKTLLAATCPSAVEYNYWVQLAVKMVEKEPTDWEALKQHYDHLYSRYYDNHRPTFEDVLAYHAGFQSI